MLTPDDLAAKEIAEHQSRLSGLVATYGKCIADSREQIAKTKERLHKYGTNEANWNVICDMLAEHQSRLDLMQMHRDRAERAELRGPPFASAVWRVGAVRKK